MRLPPVRAVVSGPIGRFGAASVAATLTTLVALGLLLWTTPLAPWADNVVATTLGTVVAWELNRAWVWGPVSGRRWEHGAAFGILSAAGLGLSTFAVDGAASWAAHAHLTGWGRTFLLQTANVAAFALLTVIKFAVSRGLFARVADRAEAGADAG